MFTPMTEDMMREYKNRMEREAARQRRRKQQREQHAD